jgi:CheY-like chemotaxis protein
MIKKSILLIDNAEPLTECLADTLKMEGYDVVVASNRFTALTILEQKKPDLIITDLSVPGIESGFIRGLRECIPSHAVPVIAISADARHRNAQRQVASEANFFAMLPFDDELFLQMIGCLTNT